MGDTWIADICHFLNHKGDFPLDLPGPALKLAQHFTKIIESLTSNDQSSKPIDIDVRCRRLSARKRCEGHIIAHIQEDLRIRWHCSECNDNGYISGWQDTKWDKSVNGI